MKLPRQFLLCDSQNKKRREFFIKVFFKVSSDKDFDGGGYFRFSEGGLIRGGLSGWREQFRHNVNGRRKQRYRPVANAANGSVVGQHPGYHLML